MRRMRIAVDGPAASGKSTVARTVAQRLGLRYLSTGLLYRAVALAVIRSGDPKTILATDEGIGNVLSDMDLDVEFSNGDVRVLLSSEDVTDLLSKPEVTEYVSEVSAIPSVRRELLEIQKKYAGEGSVVMDGRDIGTVVMPEAELKIFLTASVNERAKRRYLEMRSKDVPVELAQCETTIRKRDRIDSSRSLAPLKKAEDALEIDTTCLSIDQVVDRVLRLVQSCCEDVS